MSDRIHTEATTSLDIHTARRLSSVDVRVKIRSRVPVDALASLIRVRIRYNSNCVPERHQADTLSVIEVGIFNVAVPA